MAPLSGVRKPGTAPPLHNDFNVSVTQNYRRRVSAAVAALPIRGQRPRHCPGASEPLCVPLATASGWKPGAKVPPGPTKN
ncbi:hypothetical protein GCM10009526_24710 [Glutamicibacter creatinolyticus]